MYCRKKSVVLNAAGLHGGGAVQVATSFIDEISRLDCSDLEIGVLVSSEVHKNLSELGVAVDRFDMYRVFNVYGFKAFFSGISAFFYGKDVVFTIFGPTYYPICAKKRVVGFAQAWVAYPDNEVYRLLPCWQRVSLRLKYFVQRLCFSYADKYIVELAHLKERIVSIGLAHTADVAVVHNTLAKVYFQREKWKEPVLPVKTVPGVQRIGFVGSDYFHKNLGILPSVKQVLLREHGINADFLVTLTDKEWNDRDSEFQRAIINVGPLTMAQCPSFYQAVDGVIFPSLLESFSVTPLEAMAMRKPLFASDREFVREVCKQYPFYFDPLDAASVAASIAKYFERPQLFEDRLARAQTLAYEFSSARRRAEDYLRIIRECCK